MPCVDTEIADRAESSSCDLTPPDAECDQTICASRQKMRQEATSDSSLESADDEKKFQGEGYRLVDLKKLSAALSEAHVCEEGEKILRVFIFLLLTISLLITVHIR